MGVRPCRARFHLLDAFAWWRPDMVMAMGVGTGTSGSKGGADRACTSAPRPVRHGLQHVVRLDAQPALPTCTPHGGCPGDGPPGPRAKASAQRASSRSSGADTSTPAHPACNRSPPRRMVPQAETSDLLPPASWVRSQLLVRASKLSSARAAARRRQCRGFQSEQVQLPSLIYRVRSTTRSAPIWLKRVRSRPLRRTESAFNMLTQNIRNNTIPIFIVFARVRDSSRELQTAHPT